MEKLFNFLSSYKTTIGLLLIYAAAMASATFIEKLMSTEAAKVLIYYSPVFILLQFLLIVNFIGALIENRYLQHRKWSLIVIHLSLVVILIGAFTTHVFGKEGTIHIREGEKIDKMIMNTSKGVFEKKMPFALELTDFKLIRYPGSQSPSSYESLLKVYVDSEVRAEKVFMNNVLDVKGYRLFQASYDEDEMGTILSVNQDVFGRTITYSGYFLLMIGFILMFLHPNSRFWKLSRQLKELRNSIKLIIVFMILSITSNAQDLSNNIVFKALERNAIPLEHAEKFGKLPVQLRGRIVPLNTFSSEVLRKLHKEIRIGNLNPDQFLLSLLAEPEKWSQVPFLSISNDELAHSFQLSENYFSYVQAFDSHGRYKLISRLNEAYHKPPSNRNGVDKDILKVDEQINTIYSLLDFKLPALFPLKNDPNHTWYAAGDSLSGFSKEDSLFVSNVFSVYLTEVRNSLKSGDWQKPNEILSSIAKFQISADVGRHIDVNKVQKEYEYNYKNIFSKVRVGYFIFGAILLALSFFVLFKDKKWIGILSVFIIIQIIACFIYHAYGIGLRWYISGYAPWSNSYETMVYVAWITVLAGFVFGRKNFMTLALATLFGGIILFVSGLNWMDPQISPLIPVLKSPWLMFHVAVIVAAYGFFGISFLLGSVNLIIMFFSRNNKLKVRVKELTIINNLSLLVGLALMTIGTFLGAIWANESWGRYWGWDPKETWALITIVVYTVVSHLHLVKKWNKQWLFNLLTILAFASVLMTYFGVNYFLSGMHSYN